MLQSKNFQFFKEVTEVSDSKVVINDMSALTLAVSGTSTSFSITVKGAIGDDFYTLNVIPYSTGTAATTITGTGLYIVEGVEGIDKIKLSLTSIDNGNVTVDSKFAY